MHKARFSLNFVISLDITLIIVLLQMTLDSVKSRAQRDP